MPAYKNLFTLLDIKEDLTGASAYKTMAEKDIKASDPKDVKERDDSDGEEVYELEVVEEDKEEELRTIETGDSVKVKQVFDEALMEIVPGTCGYERDYWLENVKLILMVISCVFALVAQFYPMPFQTTE